MRIQTKIPRCPATDTGEHEDVLHGRCYRCYLPVCVAIGNHPGDMTMSERVAYVSAAAKAGNRTVEWGPTLGL